MKLLNKTIIWISRIVGGILLLPIVIMVLLYVPPVQNWAVKTAMKVASEETGYKVTLDHVSLLPLLDLELDNLTAIDGQDTIVHTDAVVVDMDFSRILKWQLGVETVKLEGGTINTLDLIDKVQIKGSLGLLQLGSDGVDFKKLHAVLTDSRIERCDLDISMRDTTIIDTTESKPVKWTIAVGDIAIKDSHIAYHSRRDSLSVATIISNATLNDGDVDLYCSIYKVGNLNAKIDTLSLHMLALDGTRTNIYLPETSLKLENLYLDTLNVHLDDFALDTRLNNKVKGNGSHISGKVDMDFNAFTRHTDGSLKLDADASVSKADLMCIASDFIPQDIKRIYPNTTLNARIRCSGNIDDISIDTLRVRMPGVASVSAQGFVRNALARIDSLQSHVTLEAKTENLNCVKRYLGLNGIRLPRLHLLADAKINGKVYDITAHLREGRGLVRAKAHLNANNMSYNADLNSLNFSVSDFVPAVKARSINAAARINGCGTDMLSQYTRLDAKAVVRSLVYDKYKVSGLTASARVRNGHGVVEAASDNNLLVANACVMADISRKLTNADFTLDMNSIDLFRLGIAEDTLTASMIMSAKGRTDFKKTHRIDASIVALELQNKDTVYHPLDLFFGAGLSPDTTTAYAIAGDLNLDFCAYNGLERLMTVGALISKEMNRQVVEDHRIRYSNLKSLLPQMDVHLVCGNRNPIAKFLKMSIGYDFKSVSLDIATSPEDGIMGDGLMLKLNTGSVCLDTIQLNINNLKNGVDMLARVKNGPKNRVVDFETTLDMAMLNDSLAARLDFIDAKGRKGMALGASVEAADSIFKIHFTPLNPIVAYRNFTVNGDNYISINSKYHIDANLDLLADDGTGLKLYSTPDTESEQDLTVSLNNINLQELSSVIPFMPSISGMLRGDAHIVKDGSSTTISTDINVDDMKYENSPLGRIGLELAYFPNPDGTQLVDGILRQNDKDVMLLNGKYWTEEGDGKIEASATLQQLPLDLANGFIPNNMARLAGYISGDLAVKGTTSRPLLTGTISTEGLHICSDPYSINLRIPDDRIKIKDSFLDFDHIEAYANGDNPLALDGTIDFADLDNIRLNMAVKARDFNLMNSQRHKGAEAYGKVYVNLDGTVRGTLNDLNINGRLNVNGKTNVTYILKDSPLTIEDQVSSLITFCDFSDTVQVEQPKQQEQNIHMNLKIGIDEATSIHVLLDEAGQDNIQIEGGGDLTMSYSPLDGIRLYGRYTIISGTMDYSMVVVSLKDFTIEDGSYVEFTGDLLNPYLSITAYEQKKVSITQDKTSRSVIFNVGLSVTQTLKNLGLEFTLDAPNDMAMQNELAAMSLEELSRAAVTMLTTGMYLSSNSSNSSGLNTTNALNSFLQSQISSITGKALKSIDVGFGIDNTQNSQGNTQTDYNFSFAKHFWGNRVSVIIGGKVSSGNNVKNSGQSIINNVSVEYRLDNSGTRYVKAFYNKNQETLLESEIMEMGASLVLRRKTERLGELFIFRSKKKDQKSQNTTEKK